MIRLAAPALVMMLALVLAGCAEFDYGRSRLPPAGSAGDPPATYRVQRGDTLYRIAWRYGLSYKKVARWNHIGAPYTIYPGQRLTLRPSSGGSRSAATSTGSGSSSRSTRSAGTRSSSPAPEAKPPGDWRWPLKGKVLEGYSAGGSGKHGITIGTGGDDTVRAAASGRVVYSGSGLRGYGRLVIVKHNESYLTAYAYNRELLVTEGTRVDAGTPLAHAGRTPKGHTGIHFELRRNGNPVNPLKYLPSR